MTVEEREEVVRERLARGWPAHSPPHPFRGPGNYIISAANFEHEPIMAMPARRTDFEARLLEKLNETEAKIFTWVVLPNHYHVLIWVNHLDQISAVLKDLHGTTSREWNVEDRMTGKRQVWYRFHDRKIRGEKHFYRSLNYNHYNPVKHGYAASPYDWPWSSLHNYFESCGKEWLRENWAAYPPTIMGRGWDD